MNSSLHDHSDQQLDTASEDSSSKMSSVNTSSQDNADNAASPVIASIQVVGLSTGYIFGPMILFGGIGWLIGERVNSLIPVFVALGVALICTNLLLFNHMPKVVKKIQSK